VSVLKVSLWYVLRELKRRPGRFLSLAAVSAAVMCVMILVILWNEAQWRSEVMPEHEWNYHLRFYNLSEADKRWILSQPWTQKTYDIWRNTEAEAYANEFRVRVTWDRVPDVMSVAGTVMLQRGLYEREPYAFSYQRQYEKSYESTVRKWYGATEHNGLKAEDMAHVNARIIVLRNMVQNASFIRKTQNGHMMQPGNLFLLSLIALFLGAATTILILETYRLSFAEFGSLRALGFTGRQIFTVNLIETGFVNLCAIPLAVLLSYGAVRLYCLIVKPYVAEAGTVWFSLTHYIPFSILAGLILYLIFASLLGTAFVCWLYRNKSVMSLLRGEGSFTVSFVSKTSDRFENEHGMGIYNRLYTLRARRTLIRYTVVTALLLPLPLYYMVLGEMMLPTMDSPEAIVKGIYILFQIAAVLITSLCVSCSASRMCARARTGELAIIRSLGADKRMIRKISFSVATMQGIAVLVLALTVYMFLSGGFSTGYAVGSTEDAVSLGEFVGLPLLYMGSAALFVLPSVYSGVLWFLIGFFRRPIIASIRHKE